MFGTGLIQLALGFLVVLNTSVPALSLSVSGLVVSDSSLFSGHHHDLLIVRAKSPKYRRANSFNHRHVKSSSVKRDESRRHPSTESAYGRAPAYRARSEGGVHGEHRQRRDPGALGDMENFFERSFTTIKTKARLIIRSFRATKPKTKPTQSAPAPAPVAPAGNSTSIADSRQPDTVKAWGRGYAWKRDSARMD